MADETKREAEQDDGIKREKVRVVPLSAVKDFPNHPFQVKDDESMQELIHSIEVNGVLNPVIARKTEQGDYELISGHRRKHACEVLGIERIPIIVREISRDEAVIAMVDSNLQRENILPSEKAFAYKMKMEAMKRQGQRNDLTSCPMVTKSGIHLTKVQDRFFAISVLVSLFFSISRILKSPLFNRSKTI